LGANCCNSVQKTERKTDVDQAQSLRSVVFAEFSSVLFQKVSANTFIAALRLEPIGQELQ
jgi:hypothetical protein